MSIPKEAKELVDLLDAVLVKVMAKAPVVEYAELFSKLSAAVDGVSLISSEMKSEGRDELAGYLVHKLLGTLAPLK